MSSCPEPGRPPASTALTLREPPALSCASLARDEWLRTDTEGQARRWPAARVLLLDEALRAPVRERGTAIRLALRAGGEVADAPPPDAVLLGKSAGRDYWAVPLVGAADPLPPGVRWGELRSCGTWLDDTDAGLFTTAVAVLGWHAVARFCAVCGSPTRPSAAGWARGCLRHGHLEYPRTDPAVICLVRDSADEHVLLARQPSWPAGRFSVLAGFVEAGESLEGCVIREVGEEVGLTVRDIRYLGSQPWPFPRSLMIGFVATADRHAPLRLDSTEIADARWVSRAELRAALDRGAWSGAAGPSSDAALLLPGGVSIARRMLEAWAAAA